MSRTFRNALFFSLAFGSVSLTLYFFIFQVPYLTSLRRLLLAFLFGLALVTAGFIARFAALKHRTPISRDTWWNAATYSLAAVLLFLFIVPFPPNYLLAPRVNLEVTLFNAGPSNANIDVTWINTGLGDVSFRSVQIRNGEINAENQIRLEPAVEGASFTWKGRAWRQIQIAVRSTAPVQAIVRLNDRVDERQLVPVGDEELTLTVPLPWSMLPVVSQALVFLTLWISAATLMLLASSFDGSRLGTWVEKLARYAPAIPGGGLWTGIVFGVIALVFVLIGFNNRFYADDYCYTVLLRKFGLPNVIIDSYLHLNGRFMSHAINYAALSFGRLSIPLGVPGAILLVGGSTTFLLYHLFGAGSRRFRLLLSAVLSIIILVFVFLLVPDVYESVYWTLHSLIVCSGLGALNFALGLIFMLARREPERSLSWSLPLLTVLGLVTTGFHEAVSVIALILGGLLFVLFIVYRLPVSTTKNRLRIAAFLLGAAVGLGIMVVSPGSAYRYGQLGVSYNLGSALGGFVPMVRENILITFIENGLTGLLLLLSSAAIGWTMGFLLPTQVLDWQYRLRRFDIFILALLPVGLFLVSFLPSAFARGYFPQRTLIAPLYVQIFSGFLLAFLAGNTRPKEPAARKLAAVGLVALVLAVSAFSAVKTTSLYQQMSAFAEEWDAREAHILASVQQGVDEIEVTPYLYTFGTDVSTNQNHWFRACYDDYYGVRITLSTR